MTKPDPGALGRALSELFDAEREAKRRRDELATSDPDELLGAAQSAIADALAHPDHAERALRLTSLAGLVGEIDDAAAVDALIDILGADQAEARYAAGVELEDRAFERFKEVALAVERALERLSPGNEALGELPYVLLEVPEPGVEKLLYRFLEHPDPEAAASAIEVLVDRGDAGGAPRIAKLVRDTRMIEGRDDEDPEGPGMVLGELAAEAVALLSPRPRQPPTRRHESGRRGRS